MRTKRDDNEQYINSVAECVRSLEWSKLAFEVYCVNGRDKIIAVRKDCQDENLNYFDIYEAVYVELPNQDGIILPKTTKDYLFIDLSFGYAHEVFKKYRTQGDKAKFNARRKRILGGDVMDDIIDSLSHYNRSMYYDITYTPRELKKIGVSDYDLSLVEKLDAHGDALFVSLARSIFILYSYSNIGKILSNLCKRYTKFYLSDQFLLSIGEHKELVSKRNQMLAQKDFYSHTKTLFECYKPLFDDAERRRVWNDVALICEREILNNAVEDIFQGIPCLNTKATVEELERLWTWLIKERHIDNSVTKEDFIHYFRREAGQLPTRKLLWIGHSKDVLFAVIEILHPKTDYSNQGRRKKITTAINWNDVNAIFEAPHIKLIDKDTYRSLHRRSNKEIIQNKYADMVDMIHSIIRG